MVKMLESSSFLLLSRLSEALSAPPSTLLNRRDQMNQFGIMQGRLVPPEPGRLQAFPRERWADEFALAAEVPLGYIEWIYDAYGEEKNPLGTTEGIAQLVRLAQATGVQIRSLCADWFMDYPLLRSSVEQLNERLKILSQLIVSANNAGIGRIVLPFVDASAIENDIEQDKISQLLKEILPIAEESFVELHLETSLDPKSFAQLLQRVPHPMVKVNYDIGNSASLGFQPGAEFDAYGSRIGSVHIKDRLLGGGTVPLGTGHADFDTVFSRLKKIGYAGDFTMQVARGVPGDEVDLARKNLEFIRHYWQ